MKLPEGLTVEDIMGAYEGSLTSLDNPGFCMACGEEHDDVEPDARNYKCESCGEDSVFGAEDLVLRIPT
jgi:hypothetical protein